MSTIIKEGDLTAGSEGYTPTSVIPRTSTGFANSVFIEGVGVVCQGDSFAPHTNGTDVHTPTAGASGSNVFIGSSKKEAFTVTTAMEPGCGDLMSPVVGTVIAG